MKSRTLISGVLLLALSLAGFFSLTNRPAPGPEQPERFDAWRNAAPAGSLLNAAQESDVPGEDDVDAPVAPVTMQVNQIVIQPDRPNLLGENLLESPLSAAERVALQAAALNLPVDGSVQDVAAAAGRAPIRTTHFEAIDYAETGTSTPPDPEIAVGPDHIVAVVNVAIQIYDKSGAELTAVVPANDFFGPENDCDDEFLYDPNALYDEEADRFVIGFDQGPGEMGGGYCLAVSQTGDPTGAWWLYFFPFNNAAEWLDFPQAAVADSYIAVTGNLFDYATPPNFLGTKIWAFAKARLYIGGALAPSATALGTSYFTMQPLHLHGAAQGSWPLHGERIYFLADHFDGANYTLFVWEPGSIPAAISTINLGQAGLPIITLQNGAPLESNDYRLLDFEFRSSYGWLTQTVSCNPGGTISNCLRWAQIRLADGTLGPAGSGTYGSSSEFRIYPDLAVNRCGDMAIGYTKSSSGSFPGIWYTGRKASETAGTLQAEAQLKAGEVAYTSFGTDPAPHRWGDYTGMTIDPDGLRFWYIGEYSKAIPAAAKWATYIGAFTYPDCQPHNVTDRIYLPLVTRP